MLIYTSSQKLGFFVRVSQVLNIFGLTWRKALSVRKIKISVALGTPRVTLTSKALVLSLVVKINLVHLKIVKSTLTQI